MTVSISCVTKSPRITLLSYALFILPWIPDPATLARIPPRHCAVHMSTRMTPGCTRHSMLCDALKPLPKSFPQLTLFPTAKARINDLLVDSLINLASCQKVLGRGLVKDGFNKHLVVEFRLIADGVFGKFLNHGVNCRLKRIADDQA